MAFKIDYTIFQNRLRELIDSHGKLAQEVAEETGISKISISRYLNNHREPELRCVAALAQYFNVSIDWILGFSNDKFDFLTPEAKEIVHLFSLASPDDRRVIEAVLGKYRKEQ